MRRFGTFAGAVLAFVVSLLVATGAAEAGDRVGIGVKVGTLGLGVDLTGRVNNWFSVRGSVNAYDLTKTYSDTDIDYDADATLGAYGVLLDFHPFRGNFRLTAGYMKNRNQIDLEAVPTADVEIGDTTYTPAEVGTLTGGVQFEDSAAYFGLGFGSAAKGPGRVRFVLDVGALMQGAGDVTIASSTGLVSGADLAKEEAEIEDDISSVSFWPVLAFGISFRL